MDPELLVAREACSPPPDNTEKKAKEEEIITLKSVIQSW